MRVPNKQISFCLPTIQLLQIFEQVFKASQSKKKITVTAIVSSIQPLLMKHSVVLLHQNTFLIYLIALARITQKELPKMQFYQMKIHELSFKRVPVCPLLPSPLQYQPQCHQNTHPPCSIWSHHQSTADQHKTSL